MAPNVLVVFEGNSSASLVCSSATLVGSSGTRHGMALIPSGNGSPEKHVLLHSHRLTIPPGNSQLGKHIYSHQPPVHEESVKARALSKLSSYWPLVPNHEACACFVSWAPALHRCGSHRFDALPRLKIGTPRSL
ncbi:hypothetical protein DPMN_165288 [Dreissena polymorpha]|uniref:Uncharacterized protein n=1 Tax=Dreissena polymorpha TaxID=45954 RepID=A0A9D4EXD3_DREPO|nr:hypothetical protein DPMN_165288 [Dreissena polymorpha]